MSNLEDVNKWAAKECGVKLPDGELGSSFYYKGELYTFPFTIEDARGRELFRNWWLSEDGLRYIYQTSIVTQYKSIFPFGENFIKAEGEDEIACITKLFEASHP